MTAETSNPQRKIDLHFSILVLWLVELTVNYDDPLIKKFKYLRDGCLVGEQHLTAGF